jgi:thioredoxin-dependent peroxiredoxin
VRTLAHPFAAVVLVPIAVAATAACGKSSDSKLQQPARTEQTDVISRGSGPLTLLGPTLDVGDPMPDVTLADGKLEAIKLASFKGKVIVLSVVPSIDTRVCETQTHKVSDLMAQMPPNVEVFTVSRDLPFAQTRFAEEAMTKTKFGSDFRERDFGRAFGVDVKETGLLARSVWVIAPDGKIAYRQLVANQGTEPDYDALMAAVKRAAGA